MCSDPLAKRSALISIYCAFPIFAHGVFRNELYNLFLKDIIVHFISFSQSFTLEKEKCGAMPMATWRQKPRNGFDPPNFLLERVSTQ